MKKEASMTKEAIRSKDSTIAFYPRTSEGLRDILWDTLEGLAAQTVTPQDAQARANVAKGILNSIVVEIEFHKHVRRPAPNGNTPATVLRLSSRND